MEVFTISGATLAEGSASAPDFQYQSPGVGSRASSLSSSAPAPVLLQNALKALGTTHGDSALSGVGVDGIIGPATVKAVNYALKTYVGAGPVQSAGLSGRFLNATATKSDVQQYAGTLAAVVTTAVQQQGGTVPAPTVTHRASGGGSSAAARAAAAGAIQDNTGTMASNPNLVWIFGGGALLVVALGFMAAHRRANA
jgi:hypothetical protein